MRGVTDADVIIVGSGAAGLATAIFVRRAAESLRVISLDGARHLGAKILVSGGSRCNVTNRSVEPHDFWGSSTRDVKRVLQAFPAPRAAAFFEQIGVALHEEEDGKLFPDSHRARTVLDALLREAAARDVTLLTGRRVRDIQRSASHFRVVCDDGQTFTAARVVLATGGRSLPKTGSDGFGYSLARALGHGYVETTPALAPLVLEGDRHRGLAGIAHRVALTCGDGRARVRFEGALLWTHFGISGPVALDISRHWHRAALSGAAPVVTVNVCPTQSTQDLHEWLQEQREQRPRALVHTVLNALLPAAVAAGWCESAGLSSTTGMSHLTREQRVALVDALQRMPLQVRDSRGYSYAEVTAGGIPLEEVDVTSMESSVCRGLFIVGEVLNVDGRLGGFNFQWAWSTAWVAAHAIARACDGASAAAAAESR